MTAFDAATRPLEGTDAVVVGGGFGGLSTACYLARDGADVTVIEATEQLGGRAGVLEADGFRFDMGPSWYLMPDVFERFFGHFDRTPVDFYELERLDPHYRVYFKDGDRADVPADRPSAVELFDSYEAGAGETLERYLDDCERNYEVAMEHFVYADRTRWRDFLDPAVARHARGLTLLGSMQGHVSDYFDHPKLQQLVQYSLVFLGGSPHNTPALYSLMSHVDFNLGVWYPEDGIGSVVEALVDLGRELGVTYYTDRPATAIRPASAGSADAVSDGGIAESRGDRLVGTTDRPSGDLLVETTEGPLVTDVVVSNADYAHTEIELLEPEHRRYDEEYWQSRTYAPSAFLAYLGLEGELEELAHHTLVLPTDWDPHFERIFEDPAWPSNPAYYVCAPSRTDPTVAPDGHAALFVLVPIAPGLEDGPERREAYLETVLEDLATNAGVDLRDRIVFRRTFSVSDFASRYNSYRGTALGLAHTLRQTAPLRPARRSKHLDGLYHVGADTTPGIGMPMCLISGEHAAAAVRRDRGSPR